VEQSVKEVRDRKATGDDDVFRDVAYTNYWAKMVSDEWRILRTKLAKCYIWSIALYGAETLDTSESRLVVPESFATC
jgi:hypothetical protein